MRSHRFVVVARFTLALLLFAAAGHAASSGPSPELTPTDVVRLQLEAFRADDARGAYRFASPGNRGMIGSPAEFAQLIKRQYADMLTQTSARVSLKQRDDDTAQVLAELQQVNGQETAYVFFLSRQQEGDCNGCWMTDGVFPLQPANDQPLYSI
ncbi:DUF4864 domain-containing protein [Salinisphaera aquimarina]|uniref:DUF4864 domain-containing protein n=1 Tax=Salinisphaera aquimarina TaxID=2094031 RepID=A0ABV7EQ18_9GAMM